MFNRHARSFRNLSGSQPERQPVCQDEAPIFLICEEGSKAYITSNAQEIAQLRKHYGREFATIAIRVTHNQHGYTTTHFAGKRFETPAKLLNAWYGL